MKSNNKNTLVGLLALLSISIDGYSQNTPKLNQTAPAGSATAITVPQEVNVNQSLNYVDYFIPSVPLVDTNSFLSPSPSQFHQSRSFRDGNNLTYQSVSFNAVVTAANQAKDIIHISDNRPQQDRISFLPFSRNAYTGNGSGAISSAFHGQKNYYASKYSGEGYTSYSKMSYTSDGGMRQTEIYAPGKSQVGQSRREAQKRIVNHQNQVRMWRLNASGAPVSNGYYPPNTLYGDSITNQEGVPVVTYYDKAHRLVLKQVADSAYLKFVGDVGLRKFGFQETYYVYDDMGLLRYTLTPKAVQASGSTIASGVLNNLCFQFKYDNKGRLSQKRKPGENAFTDLVYDRKQRLVMRRTPKERNANQWEVIFYDKNGRVIATSLFNNSGDRVTWQNAFDNYNGATFPVSNIKYYIISDAGAGKYPPENAITGNTIMSYNWYDNYNNTDPGDYIYNELTNSLNFTEFLTSPGAEISSRGVNTHGLLTGKKERILPAPGVDTGDVGEWRQSVFYYDNKGRIIYKASFDIYNSINLHSDYSGIQYDFRNRVILTKHKLINEMSRDGIIAHTELTKNVYQNSTGDLMSTYHKVDDGGWEILAKYEYDDLGRVKRQVLGDYGEVRDYDYNIRGQLASINGKYAETGDKEFESRSFGESLKYDFGFEDIRHDGKVSGMIWRGSAGVYGKALAYGYAYDPAGRLVRADFREGEAQNGVVVTPTAWDKVDMDYSIDNLHYDKNGNIISKDMMGPGFQPNGSGSPTKIDKLKYEYAANSNRLLSVRDGISVNYGNGDFQDGGNADNDYAYDANGNLIKDLNKDIAKIIYTFFNKPQQIKTKKGTIYYSYTASGSKVQELVRFGKFEKKTDYIGNFIYQNDSLQFAATSVGRTVWNSDTVKEEFFVKDHLGNIRSVVDVYHYPLLQYMASFEIASAQLEGIFFDNMDGIREDKPGSSDPEDTKAGRLNGAEPEHRVGTSILLKVMAGDRVQLNADNYYDGTYFGEDDQPVSTEDMLDAIVTTLMNGDGGLGESESHNPDMVQEMFNPENYLQADELMHSNADPDRPKAFLNYILFDENMQVVSNFTGAWQANGNGSWQTIGNMEPMTIPLNGYLAVYVSSATNFEPCGHCNPSEGDVFFDKIKIRLTKGNLKQENHYYPYGLPMAGLGGSDMNMTRNRQRYQGNEFITEAGLNWMSFGARQYDPQIGRFLSVDPLAGYGNQDRFSPYAAMGDAPVTIIDPLGMITDSSSIDFHHLPEVPVIGERLDGSNVQARPFLLLGLDIFNNTGFWGYSPVNGNGWVTSPGGLSAGKGANGTLQSLTQSIGDNANENPDVATGGEGENGYNTNFEGETGGDQYVDKGKPGAADNPIDLGETVVAADRLDNQTSNGDYSTVGTISTMSSVVPVTISEATNLISKTAKYTDDIAKIGKIAGRTAVGFGVVSIGATYANYKMGNVSTGRYYAQQAINFIGFLGPWGAGISIGLTLIDAAYGDDIEKWIRE